MCAAAESLVAVLIIDVPIVKLAASKMLTLCARSIWTSNQTQNRTAHKKPRLCVMALAGSNYKFWN
jgi:hypothetical protein